MKKLTIVLVFSIMIILLFSATIKAESLSSVELSGHIDIEVNIPKNEQLSFELGGVTVNIDSFLADEVSGSIVLKPGAEIEENGTILDEAFITIKKYKPISLQFGKMRMPFGIFNNHLVSDPLTKEWEINEVGAIFGTDIEDYNLSFAAAVYSTDVSNTERLINYTCLLNYIQKNLLNLTLSVHYGPQGANVNYTDVGGSIETIFEPFIMDAEYVRAISCGNRKSKPYTAYIGLAWQAMEELEIASRYEINRDDDTATDSTKSSLVIGLNLGITNDLILSVEVRQDTMDFGVSSNRGVIKLGYEF